MNLLVMTLPNCKHADPWCNLRARGAIHARAQPPVRLDFGLYGIFCKLVLVIGDTRVLLRALRPVNKGRPRAPVESITALVTFTGLAASGHSSKEISLRFEEFLWRKIFTVAVEFRYSSIRSDIRKKRKCSTLD